MTPDAWYRVEVTVRPSSESATCGVVEVGGSEVGAGTVATTGETRVEHTILAVPKPNGEQVLGRFDDVVLRA